MTIVVFVHGVSVGESRFACQGPSLAQSGKSAICPLEKDSSHWTLGHISVSAMAQKRGGGRTSEDLPPGKVKAPRPARGGIRTRRGVVRIQGRGYRTVEYAQPPPGLRVSAGSARGRKLSSPQVHLRPMMSKVREAVFSMLYMMDALRDDGVVLDLFAGSGSVGIEAMSRGLKGGVFVDAARDCVDTTLENCEACGFGASSTGVCARVDEFLPRASSYNSGSHYNLITITPPYEEVDYAQLMSSVAESDAVGEGTFVVVEYPVELGCLPPAIGGRLIGLRNRRYGRTVIAVYACQPHMDLDPRPDEFIRV